MTLRGMVQGGKIILQTNVDLPDGTPVRIEVDPADVASQVPVDSRPIGQKLLDFVASLPKVDDLPEDFAYQHDHYLYGTPKK